jgi:hypothetical protein
MTQHAWCFIALLTLASCAAPQPTDQLPRVGYPYKYSGHMLTVREIQEIAAFAQSVEGIDHHVQTISVKSPTDVEVETGRADRPPGGPEYRDMIRIQKRHGRWVVTQKEQLKVLTFH